MLANSAWPRAGYDLGNRSRVPVAGPTRGEILSSTRLPQAPSPRPAQVEDYGGVAVAPDGSLRVARAGLLIALSPAGAMLWSHVLRQGAAVTSVHSAPVALDDGHTLLTLERSYVVVDPRGKLRRETAWEQFDDSGLAPNITPEGALIATSTEGEVAIAGSLGWTSLGSLGYDVLPPAVYGDGSLAIAGYGGSGFCRVEQTGRVRWRTSLLGADLLPALNGRQVAAVGALNEETSYFFAPGGTQIGEYGAAAIFAEYSEHEWIARSENYLARLAPDGDPIWELVVLGSARWSWLAPIVDRDGRIYLADAEGVHCFNGDGDTLFSVETDLTPTSLALASEGRLACLVGHDLLLIE